MFGEDGVSMEDRVDERKSGMFGSVDVGGACLFAFQIEVHTELTETRLKWCRAVVIALDGLVHGKMQERRLSHKWK